jgi:hypothetical protein
MTVRGNLVIGVWLSAFIGVHRRPDMPFFGKREIRTEYWPPMNADERR